MRYKNGSNAQRVAAISLIGDIFSCETASDHTGHSSKTPRPKENVFREAPSTIIAVTDREDVVT